MVWTDSYLHRRARLLPDDRLLLLLKISSQVAVELLVLSLHLTTRKFKSKLSQSQNHLSQPHPVSTAAPNASAQASGAVAAGADTLRPKASSQRAAAASEDPTARRLRAQVHCMSSLAATLSD